MPIHKAQEKQKDVCGKNYQKYAVFASESTPKYKVSVLLFAANCDMLFIMNKIGQREGVGVEYNDIYDINRRLTGRVHLRGTRWNPGEYGLVVCVWVYDGKGKVLLTRRAPEKSYPGTWENSGGAAKVGETSRQAIVRELWEETGIRASEEEFELLETGRDGNTHFDYYCLHRETPLSEIVLLPGETDGAQWATFEQVRTLIAEKKMCKIIGRQFERQEQMLRNRQNAQNRP